MNKLIFSDKKLLVANWKSNKHYLEAIDWAKTFNQAEKRDNRQYVVCPPFPVLSSLVDYFTDTADLGVQDLSPFGAGAYTGEVSGYNLTHLKVKFAILGHSERRRYFSESSQLVARKVEQALDFGITPIVCVDHNEVEDQVNQLKQDQLDQIVVAYEPVHAISTFGGQPDPIEKTLQEIQRIREFFGQQTAVIYGGSVNSETSIVYLERKEIDGLLVGGASLEAATFVKL
jgi:triosephosphate isomerase